MLHRLLLSLTLALLFGFGQQGMVTHAISHFTEEQNQQHEKSHHPSTCDKCVVYAELSSALAGSIFALPPATPAFIPYELQHRTSNPASQFAYLARAPPKLA